jgi:hypothetical protein
MVYRKGEIRGAMVDRDYPHQVALPADTVQLHYWAIEDFCRGRSRAPRGHSVFHDDTWWHVSCFANTDDAAEFRERFKGEPFNPDDRGRGANWARWTGADTSCLYLG